MKKDYGYLSIVLALGFVAIITMGLGIFLGHEWLALSGFVPLSASATYYLHVRNRLGTVIPYRETMREREFFTG